MEKTAMASVQPSSSFKPQMPPGARPPILEGFSYIDTCKFRIRTIAEAETLARFMSELFRDPERVRPGLHELLLNAVEHGCLEIGHDLKEKLMRNGTWEAEVLRRQSLPENRKKNVEIVASRRPDGIYVVITDPGPGFDWKNWIMIDPARAGETHGRGIARARSMSFDNLAYNARGNQAVAQTRDAPDIAW